MGQGDAQLCPPATHGGCPSPPTDLTSGEGAGAAVLNLEGDRVPEGYSWLVHQRGSPNFTRSDLEQAASLAGPSLLLPSLAPPPLSLPPLLPQPSSEPCQDPCTPPEGVGGSSYKPGAGPVLPALTSESQGSHSLCHPPHPPFPSKSRQLTWGRKHPPV
jgi:hypothetical protein